MLATGISLWNALRRALLSSLLDPKGAVRTRLLLEFSRFSERLAADAELRAKLDLMAADLAVFAVARYGEELTTVITHTIDRWDGKEAARKIELHVGRDLQFIQDQRHHRRRAGRRFDPCRVATVVRWLNRCPIPAPMVRVKPSPASNSSRSETTASGSASS